MSKDVPDTNQRAKNMPWKKFMNGKTCFPDFPNVGFIFAFYHHTYPGGKQKESNKSETLKLWRQERNIFPNAEVNIDFLTEKIKFWTQISMKVPNREIFFSFFISMFPIPPSFHESYI